MDEQRIPAEVLELARALVAAGVSPATLATAQPARIQPYTVPEVAAMLGVHQATIYRDVGEGRLRAIRIGRGRGAIRVPVDACEQYLRDGAVRAVTTPPRKATSRRLRAIPAGGTS